MQYILFNFWISQNIFTVNNCRLTTAEYSKKLHSFTLDMATRCITYSKKVNSTKHRKIITAQYTKMHAYVIKLDYSVEYNLYITYNVIVQVNIILYRYKLKEYNIIPNI